MPALITALQTHRATRALAMDDGTICSSHKDPAIVNAIGKFCQNQNLMVPSAYAKKGMYSNDDRGNVYIVGDCDPPQYVPRDVCFVSFSVLLPPTVS